MFLHTRRLFLFSTCFGQPCAHHQENYCINATPGLCHSVLMAVWYAGAYAPAYQTARNMKITEINVHEKLRVKLFINKDHTRIHGQQNINCTHVSRQSTRHSCQEFNETVRAYIMLILWSNRVTYPAVKQLSAALSYCHPFNPPPHKYKHDKIQTSLVAVGV